MSWVLVIGGVVVCAILSSSLRAIAFDFFGPIIVVGIVVFCCIYLEWLLIAILGLAAIVTLVAWIVSLFIKQKGPVKPASSSEPPPQMDSLFDPGPSFNTDP